MTARIYQPSKSAMQSGKSNTGGWVLEFTPETPYNVEPLMGWIAERDMRSSQVRLRFENLEEALRYAKSKELEYEVINKNEDNPPRIKSYSANFKFKGSGGR